MSEDVSIAQIVTAITTVFYAAVFAIGYYLIIRGNRQTLREMRRERLSGDAAVQFQILEKTGLDQQTWEGPIDPRRLDDLFREADWVVDGLLGTGLTRPVEGTMREVIEAMNRSARPVLALDLPSGLDADTGRPQGGAVRATITATFVAPKLGFATPGAEAFTGAVRVVEIGVPRCLLEPYGVG